MNLIQQFIDLVRTGTSSNHFYRNMNSTLKRLNGEYAMLHYPMKGEGNQTFIQRQINLTDFCIELLGEVRGLNLLEVGCGNGVQAKYIFDTYQPALMTGVDLDQGNIDIAIELLKTDENSHIQFLVDDAQVLKQIASESMDVIISIESAFHYPDKTAFLDQVERTLKPGGKFLIADLLTTKRTKGVLFRKLWKRKMVLHHWSEEHYSAFFSNSPLSIHEKIDITEKVKQGFKGYGKWIADARKAGLIREFIFRVFYIINAEWIKFLFKYRRNYLVFVGNKQA